MNKGLAKYFVENLVSPALKALGTQLGDSIGKRINTHFDPKPDLALAKSNEK